MTGKPRFEQVRKDLEALEQYEVVVYGSYCTQYFTPRSDIDVAVITREKDREKNREVWRNVLGSAPDRYDIRVFELLPLHVKAGVMEDFQVVFGDRPEITYYFYRFRKIWADQKPRYVANQFESAREKMQLRLEHT